MLIRRYLHWPANLLIFLRFALLLAERTWVEFSTAPGALVGRAALRTCTDVPTFTCLIWTLATYRCPATCAASSMRSWAKIITRISRATWTTRTRRVRYCSWPTTYLRSSTISHSIRRRPRYWWISRDVDTRPVSSAKHLPIFLVSRVQYSPATTQDWTKLWQWLVTTGTTKYPWLYTFSSCHSS